MFLIILMILYHPCFVNTCSIFFYCFIIMFSKSSEIPNISLGIEFEYIKKLGKGRFGKIYLILNKNKNVYHVVKHVEKKYIKSVQNEIDILKKIQNKSDYLLNMTDYYTVENNDVMILTDYVQNSIDLDEFIYEHNPLKNLDYLYIIIELLSGLKFLHDLNIVHMDIKPKNILIYETFSENPDKYKKYKIKYIDFGFACENTNDEYINKYRGTAQYMDPYMIEKKINTFAKSKKADIWSLGITIYKLTHQELPWKNRNKELVKKEILQTENICSKIFLFSDIINNMIQKKTRRRYSLTKLIETTNEIIIYS